MSDKELRERILTIAKKRFLIAGYRTIRTDDIANDAGISKKTLYKLFRNKKEILFGAIDLHVSEIEREFKRIFDEGDLNFVDQISALMKLLNTYLAPIGEPFLVDMVRTVPDAWNRFEHYRRTKALPRIERLIVHGIEDGYIRSDIDTHLFTLVFTDMVQHTVTPKKLEELGIPLPTAFQLLKTMLLKGLLTPSGRAYLENHNDA